MPYPVLSLFSLLIFVCVHMWAQKTQEFSKTLQSRLLSIGGGVAIAYVFIDLLPGLSESDVVVKKALSGVFPYFERHVYVMALAGFLLFFVVDRSEVFVQKQGAFWLSLASYGLFNFFVGYAVADKNNPEIQPLFLFTFAIALHYFTNDYALSKEHGDQYKRIGKWLLIICLFLGWLIGLWTKLPATAVALISAFIAGGVIMNVTRHELPEENPNSSRSFLLAAAFYTIILLAIG